MGEKILNYVPGSGSGGAGSSHVGQSKHNEGGQGKATSGPVSYPASGYSTPTNTPKPKDTSKKSPKIFG